MKYEVDEEYPFEYDKNTGFPFFPHGLTEDGNLYVLPNGKYLPRDCYICEDGSCLIYEPYELSPFREMLENCTEE